MMAVNKKPWSISTELYMTQGPIFRSLLVVSLTPAYLIINSLKHSRSLLWWRKSLGSAGISFRKTWATSSGPYNGERRRPNTQESRFKKEKAKTKPQEGKWSSGEEAYRRWSVPTNEGWEMTSCHHSPAYSRDSLLPRPKSGSVNSKSSKNTLKNNLLHIWWWM